MSHHTTSRREVNTAEELSASRICTLRGASERKIDRLGKLLFDKAVLPEATWRVYVELMEQEAFRVNDRSLELYTLFSGTNNNRVNLMVFLKHSRISYFVFF